MWILRQTQKLVQTAIGIDLESVGGYSLTRGLKERMAKCGLTDEASYLDRLRNSPQELEELVELIVVPETWFFRDEKPFNVLQKYVQEEWLPSKPSAPIKILSLPCSSGEEPYTIAMALLDIGLTPEQLQIEAFDISRHALEKALGAVYHGNSFRSREMGFRDRYFRLTEEGYVLDEKVRRILYERRASWEIERPQPALVALAAQGLIRGTVLDVGCGTGENALHMAALGLPTWGIDIVPGAIAQACARARQRGLPLGRFLVADVLALETLGMRFDTVIDSGLFHALSDAERPFFLRGLDAVLEPGGSYHLLGFSELVPGTIGPRRLREEEIRGVFAHGWQILRLERARFETNLHPGGAAAWLAMVARR
jgi:SAM-dependent methyltransferase